MTGDKATRYLILILALALAAYGQHIMDSREAFGSGWLAIDWLNDELTRIYNNERQSVALALPLLGFAAWFFVESINPLLPRQPAEPGAQDHPPTAPPAAGVPPHRKVALALAIVAVAGWTLLIVQLARGGNQADNWWLFWGSLATVTLAFALFEGRSLGRTLASLHWHPLEYAFAAAVVGCFVGLMTFDLDYWTYARIGDEGQFWEFGKNLADRTHDYNFFTIHGPYYDHPMMSSVYRGLVMRFAGTDLFGWKLASTIAIAVSLPVFYWLIRLMAGTRAALFGTVILASNHVMFAYAHTGYDNILALFPALLSLAFFAAGWRTRAPLFFFLCGVWAGLGFYTFHTARATIFILAIFVASEYLPHWWRTRSNRWLLNVLTPLAIGFVMAVLPIFATDGSDVITATSGRSLFSESGWGAALGTMIDNIPRSFLAFSFWPAHHHYVSGSFLDEISAVLAIFGFAFTLANFKKPMYRLLLIWFVVAVVVGGVLHEHAATELPSRLNFAVPPAAAFAGIAIDKLVLAFAALYPKRWSAAALTAVTFLVFVPTMFGFNAHRFWKETPSVHVLTNTAVIYKEATSEACDVDGYFNVVIANTSEQGGIQDVFDWDARGGEAPVYIAYSDPQNDEKRQAIFDGTFADGAPIACIMFTLPENEADYALIDSYIDELERQRGDWTKVTDKAGASDVVVLDWLSRNPRTTNDEPAE